MMLTPQVGDVYLLCYGNRDLRGTVTSVDEHSETANVRFHWWFGLLHETRVHSFATLNRSHRIYTSRRQQGA